MGIEISPKGKSIPREVVLTLTCDGNHHMFDAPSQTFRHPDGFIPEYEAAMKAGWKEVRRDGERAFLCPACSGKLKR